VAEQTRALRPLARFFELEGWKTSTDSSGALRCDGPRSMTIGVYPALLDSRAAEADHPTANQSDAPRVILPDYLVERDLPSAYQRAAGLSGASTGAVSPPAAPPAAKGRVVELPVKDLKRSDQAESHGRVRVVADVGPDRDAFAVRVPTPGLKNAGFSAGAWLVVRPVAPTDLGRDGWVVVLRARGKFGATGANWTIAHVKELPGDEGAPSRLQVSYGSATGREFRPERLERAELTLAATIVCHTDEAT